MEKKNNLWTAICIICVLGGLAKIKITNEAQLKYIGENKVEESAYFKTLCRAKQICEEYEKALQGCASAGSIDRCVQIKTKDADNSICKEDKTLLVGDLYAKDDLIPSKFQCLIKG